MSDKMTIDEIGAMLTAEASFVGKMNGQFETPPDTIDKDFKQRLEKKHDDLSVADKKWFREDSGYFTESEQDCLNIFMNNPGSGFREAWDKVRENCYKTPEGVRKKQAVFHFRFITEQHERIDTDPTGAVVHVRVYWPQDQLLLIPVPKTTKKPLG